MTLVTSPLTCEELLAYFEGVDEWREDALDGAEHAAQAQVDQHEEEHHGPEGRGGEVGHGLGEGDEGQPRALNGLREREQNLSEPEPGQRKVSSGRCLG